MRIVVVGAGVMGLSAARVLAERGHEVTAVEQFGVGNPMASSAGATRIWRIAHPDRAMVRLAQWNVALWRELEERSGRQLRSEHGLLWRGGDALRVAHSLAAENVEHEVLDEAGQYRHFPELGWQPERPVVWQPEAGTLLAAESLAASADLFAAAGGELVTGVTVSAVEQAPNGGARVVTSSRAYHADVAVVTAGPWAAGFLDRLGLHVDLEAVLAQVTYVRGGVAAWQIRPCLIDVPDEGGSFGLYAVPTPGIGYKVGIDESIRHFDGASSDRMPDRAREQETVDRIRQDFPGIDATPIRSEVCAWTSSPDDQFILDRVEDVVVGCGDSGQGFKFLPMIGEVLADLVEGREAHPDAGTFQLRRFG